MIRVMGKKDHAVSCHFIVLDSNGVNHHNCSVRAYGSRRQLEGLLRDVRYGVDALEPRRVTLLADGDTHI